MDCKCRKCNYTLVKDNGTLTCPACGAVYKISKSSKESIFAMFLIAAAIFVLMMVLSQDERFIYVVGGLFFVAAYFNFKAWKRAGDIAAAILSIVPFFLPITLLIGIYMCLSGKLEGKNGAIILSDKDLKALN